MARHLLLTVRFLLGTFRGQQDAGEPEWPPSPLRVFQALTTADAAATRGARSDHGRTALRWLESLAAPLIVAPPADVGHPMRIAVPNNDMDVVATAWARGRQPREQPSELETLKTVRAMHLRHGQSVHYVWLLGAQDAEPSGAVEAVCWMARNVVAVGWGIDVAIGDARVADEAAVAELEGVRWVPAVGHGERQLRVPREGTLQDLDARYAGFQARIGERGYTPPASLTSFHLVAYRRAAVAVARGAAAFALLRLDGSAHRAFDPVRRGLTVAGMVRHAARRAAERAGWADAQVARVVLGHGAQRDVPVGPRRFAYVPLPSIEFRGPGARVAGPIRRVLITTFADDMAREIEWTRRALSGMDLLREPDGQPTAMLSALPNDDRQLAPYLSTASAWVSVTPVVLPGYDDPDHVRRRGTTGGLPGERQRDVLQRLDQRVDKLLRKAIRHSGLPDDLAANAVLEWGPTGFFAGVDMARRYGVPDHLRMYPRLHVVIRWRDAQGQPIGVPGPICIGSGRFLGLGLMVVVPEDARA